MRWFIWEIAYLVMSILTAVIMFGIGAPWYIVLVTVIGVIYAMSEVRRMAGGAFR